MRRCLPVVIERGPAWPMTLCWEFSFGARLGMLTNMRYAWGRSLNGPLTLLWAFCRPALRLWLLRWAQPLQFWGGLRIRLRGFIKRRVCLCQAVCQRTVWLKRADFTNRDTSYMLSFAERRWFLNKICSTCSLFLACWEYVVALCMASGGVY